MTSWKQISTVMLLVTTCYAIGFIFLRTLPMLLP